MKMMDDQYQNMDAYSAYPTGPMNSLVYPVTGGYEDWAYASSFEPDGVSRCEDESYRGRDREGRDDGNGEGGARNKDNTSSSKGRYTPLPDASLRAFNILVETSDNKHPPDERYGSHLTLPILQKFYRSIQTTAGGAGNDNHSSEHDSSPSSPSSSPSSLSSLPQELLAGGRGDGHVPRNVRLSLALIDLVQPYVQWTMPSLLHLLHPNHTTTTMSSSSSSSSSPSPSPSSSFSLFPTDVSHENEKGSSSETRARRRQWWTRHATLSRTSAPLVGMLITNNTDPAPPTNQNKQGGGAKATTTMFPAVELSWEVGGAVDVDHSELAVVEWGDVDKEMSGGKESSTPPRGERERRGRVLHETHRLGRQLAACVAAAGGIEARAAIEGAINKKKNTTKLSTALAEAARNAPGLSQMQSPVRLSEAMTKVAHLARQRNDTTRLLSPSLAGPARWSRKKSSVVDVMNKTNTDNNNNNNKSNEGDAAIRDFALYPYEPKFKVRVCVPWGEGKDRINVRSSPPSTTTGKKEKEEEGKKEKEEEAVYGRVLVAMVTAQVDSRWAGKGQTEAHASRARTDSSWNRTNELTGVRVVGRRTYHSTAAEAIISAATEFSGDAVDVQGLVFPLEGESTRREDKNDATASSSCPILARRLEEHGGGEEEEGGGGFKISSDRDNNGDSSSKENATTITTTNGTQPSNSPINRPPKPKTWWEYATSPFHSSSSDSSSSSPSTSSSSFSQMTPALLLAVAVVLALVVGCLLMVCGLRPWPRRYLRLPLGEEADQERREMEELRQGKSRAGTYDLDGAEEEELWSIEDPERVMEDRGPVQEVELGTRGWRRGGDDI